MASKFRKNLGKRYTVMMVPDHSSGVRRFRVSGFFLWGVLFSSVLLFGALVAGGIHYALIVDEVSETSRLREENVELRNQLLFVHEKVASAQSILDRIQRFDTKLRTITQLHDPKRHLAMGPYDIVKPAEVGLGDDKVLDPVVLAIAEKPHMAVQLLGKRLDELLDSAEKREGSIRQLETFLRGQKVRLASTPSIWPARGWVTSEFGMRTDPYTGKLAMHQGVDIANQLGVPVVSPARGTVTFAGIHGGFGKVIVIDHGYGMRTRYGHLNTMTVSVGDRVERGESIGTIGNTGRSTGPHLHYEVEVSGVCENPMGYILED